jgi:hypothetical protein
MKPNSKLAFIRIAASAVIGICLGVYAANLPLVFIQLIGMIVIILSAAILVFSLFLLIFKKNRLTGEDRWERSLLFFFAWALVLTLLTEKAGNLHPYIEIVICIIGLYCLTALIIHARNGMNKNG